MQIIASFLALAALSAATPHLHHRHVHQKKNPMPMPDMNEALIPGMASDHISTVATATAKATAAVASVAVVASSAAAAAPAAASSVVAAAVPAASPAAAAASVAAAPAVQANVKTTVSTAITDITGIVSRLSAIAVQQGSNSQSNNGAVWIGSDGSYTNTFTNSAGSDVILVVWGNEGSWVNKVKPHITVNLTPGASVTLSFGNGQSGGWAGIYPDTVTQNGQIMNTWGEYTFSNPWSTVDVSREVKMSGHGMSINTPNCVTDMDTCVFVCTDGTDSCWYNYTLKNCENGSQKGAQKGTFAGAASGGCGNMGASAHLTTTLH